MVFLFVLATDGQIPNCIQESFTQAEREIRVRRERIGNLLFLYFCSKSKLSYS